MKQCAVFGCCNGTFQIEKWKSEDCEKHGTRNGLGCCDCPKPFDLYPFPTEKKDALARKRWNKLMNKTDVKTNKNWENKKHDRVCSQHFPDGKPTKEHPDPILQLGYSTGVEQNVTPKRAPPTLRTPYVKKRRIDTQDEIPETEITETPIEVLLVERDHRYTYKCDCCDDCKCSGCITKQDQINALEHKVNDLQEKIISLKIHTKKKGKTTAQTIHSSEKHKQAFNSDTLKTDNEVSDCTGLRSKQAFGDLFKYLEPHAKKMSYWKGSNSKSKSAPTTPTNKPKGTPKKCGSKRKMHLKEEFLLTLMRLRLGLTINFLALIFGIVPSSCSQIVNTWVRFLAVTLEPLIVWPSRAAINITMPSQFKERCRKIRCIIDCTEIYIERPRSLELQAATWSDYKKHNTIKVLVGITPNGHISFLSKAYGGRASDVFIVRKSGFLSLIEPKDILMADRGFPIQEDLMLHHASLEIPPAAQGNRQMTRSKVKTTKGIANLRIHVERAINRLKVFKIIDGTLPISLIPAADDILKVCSALVNLQPDLIK